VSPSNCVGGLGYDVDMKSELFEKFLELLPTGALVVDLGAGDGKWSEKLVEAGHRTIAVEKKEVKSPNGNIDWQNMAVADWLESLPDDFVADGYWLKNVLQFLDKEFVLKKFLPALHNHIHKNGVIAIETFTKSPDPEFAKNHPSYYRTDELERVFKDWEIIWSEEVEKIGRDMKGRERKFFLTRFLVKK